MQDAKDYHNQLFAQKAKEEEAKRSAEWREKMEKGLRNAAPVSKAGPKSKVPDIPSVANNNWPLWERVKDAASSFLGPG